MAKTFRLLRRSADHTFVLMQGTKRVQIIVSLPESMDVRSDLELTVTDRNGAVTTAKIDWDATQRLRGDIDAYIEKTRKES